MTVLVAQCPDDGEELRARHGKPCLLAKITLGQAVKLLLQCVDDVVNCWDFLLNRITLFLKSFKNYDSQNRAVVQSAGSVQ